MVDGWLNNLLYDLVQDWLSLHGLMYVYSFSCLFVQLLVYMLFIHSKHSCSTWLLQVLVENSWMALFDNGGMQSLPWISLLYVLPNAFSYQFPVSFLILRPTGISVTLPWGNVVIVESWHLFNWSWLFWRFCSVDNFRCYSFWVCHCQACVSDFLFGYFVECAVTVNLTVTVTTV